MTPFDRDPRPALAPSNDSRPVVARSTRPLSIWVTVGGFVLAGIVLFVVLDGHRRASTAPTAKARSVDVLQTVQSPPPLYLPPDAPAPPPPPVGLTDPVVIAAQPSFIPPLRAPAQLRQQPPIQPIPFAPQPPPPGYAPPPTYTPPPSMPPPQGAVATNGGGGSTASALVIDTMRGPRRGEELESAAGQNGQGVAGQNASGQGVVVRATAAQSGRLRLPASTVAQGSVIPAVLETAIDSTQPGPVRAVVSRDVRGFDGSRVLIPRGSRLFGAYQTDLSPGQSRALVEWTRLVRPDGVTIALSSPAGDLQGRSGIGGRVDNHFLQRFGAALLRTTLDVGAAVAGRSLSRDAGVIIALPGSTQTSGSGTTARWIQPTLRVEAGARVTALVSRDLEFVPNGSTR